MPVEWVSELVFISCRGSLLSTTYSFPTCLLEQSSVCEQNTNTDCCSAGKYHLCTLSTVPTVIPAYCKTEQKNSIWAFVCIFCHFFESLTDKKRDRLYLWHILCNLGETAARAYLISCLLQIGSIQIFKCHHVAVWHDISYTRVNLHTYPCGYRLTPRTHLHPFCSTVNRLLVKVKANAHASTGILIQELLFLSIDVTILNGPLYCQRSY